MGMPESVKAPAVFVNAVLVAGVVETEAPAAGAPVGSVTVPAMDPSSTAGVPGAP